MLTFQLGDNVLWSHAWGKLEPRKARILSIESAGTGEEVTEGETTEEYLVTLDNGHWAYGWQITEVLNGTSAY